MNNQSLLNKAKQAGWLRVGTKALLENTELTSEQEQLIDGVFNSKYLPVIKEYLIMFYLDHPDSTNMSYSYVLDTPRFKIVYKAWEKGVIKNFLISVFSLALGASLTMEFFFYLIAEKPFLSREVDVMIFVIALALFFVGLVTSKVVFGVLDIHKKGSLIFLAEMIIACIIVVTGWVFSLNLVLVTAAAVLVFLAFGYIQWKFVKNALSEKIS